jgi:hypothetical protein
MLRIAQQQTNFLKLNLRKNPQARRKKQSNILSDHSKNQPTRV